MGRGSDFSKSGVLYQDTQIPVFRQSCICGLSQSFVDLPLLPMKEG